MKVSYNWLQTYFDKPLPSAENIAERLTMHSFEIEAVEKIGNDSIFSVDILPNRAHDCLCHLGMAREISALFNLPLKVDPFKQESPEWDKTERLIVDIQETAKCLRYSALIVSGVKVAQSPDWLKERLEAIGQRSINNIVDSANFVMFSIGQPLHVFDLSKLEISAGLGAILVRDARDGERIMTLDKAEYSLMRGDLVIADGNSDKPLALAGIKGGFDSGVDGSTTHVVIESANFKPESLRRTSRRLGLRTEASSRFEHEISPGLTLFALKEVEMLIKHVAQGELVVTDGVNDSYFSSKSERDSSIIVELGDITSMLGMDISAQHAQTLLQSVGMSVAIDQHELKVSTPFYRLDLKISEDVIEEVGRLSGFDKLKSRAIAPRKPALISKRFYYASEARRIFSSAGFSEVYTYSFASKGVVEVAKPLASDKGFLRSNLSLGLKDAMEFNERNADLLGLDSMLIFELGTVFTKNGEFFHLGFGAKSLKKNKTTDFFESFKNDKSVLALALANQVAGVKLGENIVEVDFDKMIEDLPEPKKYEWNELIPPGKFKPISPFPYVLRDLALWTPVNVEIDEILKIIIEKSGALLLSARLTDIYKKDNRISRCFRLIFQSLERTLTDEEINLAIWHLSAELNSQKDWEVR